MFRSLTVVTALAFSSLAAAQQPTEEEMMQMMAQMQKLATPGKEHKALAALEGEWTVHAKMKMAPDAPWTETKGTCSFHSLLGGRYVMQKVNMMIDFMGQKMPMEGMNLLGYNNMKKVYTSRWYDTWSTWGMASQGTMNDKGQIVFKGMMIDAMTRRAARCARSTRTSTPTPCASTCTTRSRARRCTSCRSPTSAPRRPRARRSRGAPDALSATANPPTH